MFTAGKNAPAPELGLLAALALGNDDAFISYLDHKQDRLRDKAYEAADDMAARERWEPKE